MNTVKILIVLIVIVVALLTLLFHPELVALADYTVGDYVELMTPFVLVALFIERALEVMLTPWKGPQSSMMELQIRQMKSKKEKFEEIKKKEDELQEYKNKTQLIAFTSALAVGIVISSLGLRGLELFFDADAFASLPDFQRGAIQVVDALITGALLGGGADGIHKVLALFTAYMDETKRKVKEK